MASGYKMDLELGTKAFVQSASNETNTIVGGLQNHVARTHCASVSATVVIDPGKLQPSSTQYPTSSNIPDTTVGTTTIASVPSPQPALPRPASTQSNTILVFNTNRSMSGLANNTADDGTLEHRTWQGYDNRMRPSATQHYRAGRYREALKAFFSGQRMYISILTSVLMFGMAVAGLWIGIAGSHQTLV